MKGTINIQITTILKPIDVKVDGIIILFKDKTLLNINGPNTVRPIVKNTYVRDKQDWNVDSPRNKNNIMRRFYYFIIFISFITNTSNCRGNDQRTHYFVTNVSFILNGISSYSDKLTVNDYKIINSIIIVMITTITHQSEIKLKIDWDLKSDQLVPKLD